MTPTPLIAAIGNFDGVHRGHLALLEETRALAERHGARVGAVLFDPHPRRYFAPDAPPFLLTRNDERDRLLREAGVAEIRALPFDSALAAMSPEAFVRDVLKERERLAGVVAGADFRFGAERAGDARDLVRLAEGLGMAARIARLRVGAPNEDKFSSSGARAALREGRVADAARILGRPWRATGLVAPGQKLGRTLGFPTANLSLGPLIHPAHGVYAARIQLGETGYGGVVNFGRRPTVGEGAPLLEAHLLDFDGDLYGREISVDLVSFLRPEKKFDGLDALKAQIARDAEEARRALAARREEPAP